MSSPTTQLGDDLWLALHDTCQRVLTLREYLNVEDNGKRHGLHATEQMAQQLQQLRVQQSRILTELDALIDGLVEISIDGKTKAFRPFDALRSAIEVAEANAQVVRRTFYSGVTCGEVTGTTESSLSEAISMIIEASAVVAREANLIAIKTPKGAARHGDHDIGGDANG